MSKKKKTLEGLLEEVLVPEDEQPYEILENWVWLKFNDVFETLSNPSGAIKLKNYNHEGIYPIIDQSASEIGGYTDSRDSLYKGNLPVIVFGDHTKNIKWVDYNFAQGADGTKLLSTKINPLNKYYYYCLKGIKLPDKGYSRHFKFLKEVLIPIAPLNEQKRIADKIEILFAKIDEAKQLIEEVKATFELRRAAILEKAFSGELTLEYRNVNQCIELVKPLSSSKKFTSQIDQSITSTLYSLPENWKWITLNNLIESMTYGSSAKTDDDSSGKAVLRMGNIQDGSLLNDNLKYLPLNHLDVKKFVLEENDILFNRTNSYELVGKSALVTQEFEGYSFASYLIRLSLIDKEILAPYVVTFINSKIGRKMLLSMVTQQVGQANINSQKLASLPIPLPPKNEIVEINKIIENLKAKERKAIESLNLDVDFANLKQSILSKAFKGELGTNDSTDESAIELLKSILQEKL